ncbi:MAG TPA: hypothetical protein VET23_03995 [Chitinophagaceae bacterium]|nr:hypothetical protein [Chitinophagaceae bacterium]
MRKIILSLFIGTILWSCGGNKEKAAGTTTDSTSKTIADLPYTASYSGSFSDNVSDADLKMVLVSYKDWADGNMSNVSKAYGDTLTWDKASGEHYKLPNAGIMKMWSTYRDSLSSVSIDMEAWRKMYSTDRKEGFIVAWYKETDTYKTGHVDSAYYNDINQVKDGKIVWLSQYRRDAK